MFGSVRAPMSLTNYFKTHPTAHLDLYDVYGKNPQTMKQALDVKKIRRVYATLKAISM